MAELQESDLEPSHVVDESALEGEPGHAGHDPYAKGPNAPPPEKLNTSPVGTPADAARSFANTMTFGAAPEIEGAMGVLAKAAVQPLEHRDKPQSGRDELAELLAAYKAVRDEGKRQHEQSDATALGKVGDVVGYLVPHPLLPTPAPGASLGKRVGLGAGVGAGVGGVSGAANSKADLTSDEPGQVKKLLLDTTKGMLGGAVVGGTLGGVTSTAESPTRKFAEAQALKAAGLRGGIKNAPKAMGLDTEDEALALGRKFLDEGLIPVAGSTGSVAKLAEKLRDMSGNSAGAQLAHGDALGGLDYDELGNAALQPYNDADAVMRGAGSKSLDLVDRFAEQGKMTPGSFTGANRAKASAWDSANFADDAPNAAKLYRRTTGAAARNIEDQLGRLDPAAAKALRDANARYGVAADALKLSRDAGRRDLANSSLGLREQLMLAAGIGGGAGQGLGHGAEGIGVGVGGALLANWGKKHGNALAARGADALANRFARSTGGHAGGMAGPSVGELGADVAEKRWHALRGDDEEQKQ